MRARAATAGREDQIHETFELERTQPEIAGTASAEEIRQRAYELHLERGGIHGSELDDWLQAERDLAEKYPATSRAAAEER